jgi:glycosyltransferase involved in cell wall biosynthesis
MKEPLRILHVETGMSLYGGALQVFYLLRGLKEAGNIENVLICPEGSEISIAAAGCTRLQALPMRGDLDLPFFMRFIKIINRERPHLIHLHSRRGADILGGIASRFTGTPCLLTRRVDNPENRLVVRFKYRLYDRVITISEGIRQVLLSEGIPPDKVVTVHSAVDISSYSTPADLKWFRGEFNIPVDAKVCAVVAQFIKRKGHRYLFEAIPGILDKYPETVFLLFGKGPLERRLKKRCVEMGIANKVIFAGFRDDLPRIYPCLDVLIHPALMEGLSVALLQAAASGTPIVGTRAGGIPEIVKDGVNGFLIPPGDSRAMIRPVVEILGSPQKANNMGAKGRDIVLSNFTVDSMVRGNLEVYEQLASK